MLVSLLLLSLLSLLLLLLLLLELLKKVAKAAAKVDTWLLSRRHVAVEGAPGLRPFFAAFCVVLLEWPDVELPMALPEGFELTRSIAESGVFRPVEPKPVGHKVTLEPGEPCWAQRRRRS